MNPAIQKAFQESLGELQQKSLKAVQIETAYRWAGRALAAAQLGLPATDVHEYAHEAIEHAALSGMPAALASVREAFEERGLGL